MHVMTGMHVIDAIILQRKDGSRMGDLSALMAIQLLAGETVCSKAPPGNPSLARLMCERAHPRRSGSQRRNCRLEGTRHSPARIVPNTLLLR